MKIKSEYYLQSYRVLMLDDLSEYKEVIDELNEYLKSNPNSNGFNNLGLAHFEIGEKTKALVNFSLAIKIDKLNTSAYLNRAELNTKLDNIKDAESDYDMAIKSDSSKLNSLICRAHFHKHNNNYEKALIDFRNAQKIKPDFKPVSQQIIEIEQILGINPKI